MNYKTNYIIPFKSIDGHEYKVEIQKDGYTGDAICLTASGDEPFTVSIDDERFIYTPTRLSTATIRVVGNDYLRDLYSVDYQQFRVNLLRDNIITWCGFVKPEIYTQEYACATFELEIECVSAFSSLDSVNYLRKKDGELSFVSILDLIKRAVYASNGSYRYVFIPRVYARSKSEYSNIVNVLNSITLSEQNFFDEDGKAMKWVEVISEICKFLNWTCCDWCGSLYFLDVDHYGQYYRYEADFSYSVYVSSNEMQVSDIGFAGSNHSLDIIGGYNKATVKCNNYPIDYVVPDEDFDSLKELESTDDTKDNATKVCHSVYLTPDKWNCILFDGSITVDKSNIHDYKDTVRDLYGATLMKYCVYGQTKDANGKLEPDITDYSYTDVIRIKYPTSDITSSVNLLRPGWYKVMSFVGASALYADGAIGISGSVKIIEDDSLIPWGNSRAGYGKLNRACRIRIGSMYYGNTSGDASYSMDWEENEKNFIVLSTESWNNDGSMDWIDIPNMKKLSMPYTGLRGFIIPINKPISGEFEFELLAANKTKKSNSDVYISSGEIIRDFKVMYKSDDSTIKANDKSDRIYENVPNEHYINELEEIELKISSYNNDGACYGKALLYGEYLTDNLYSRVADAEIRPEEHLLSRIVNQYRATKILLTQVIRNDNNINPLTRITDRHVQGKNFIVIGGDIDYYANSFTCKMIECNGGD